MKTKQIKDKLINALGSAGAVLWFGISLIIYILPFVMIGAPFLLNIILFGLVQLFPASSIIFWIWGLVCAIQGEQDFWEILYYVMFAIGFLPFFASLVLDAFNAMKKKQQPAEEDIGPQPSYVNDPDIHINCRGQ